MHRLRLLFTGGLLASALSLVVQTLHAVPLLPGVHGYGTDRSTNPAGFGTNAVVEYVTSLADTNTAGTLRYAATRTISGNPPRIIVFQTSGVIELQSNLVLNKPNITIAGQTAPYPGISIHNYTLQVKADNVLIQHLRFRTGDRWPQGEATHNRDTVQLVPDADGVVSNVVFDHCLFAWSVDEVLQAYSDYDNITFNKCIFAEPLFQSIHIDEKTMGLDSSTNRPRNAETLPHSVTNGLPSNPHDEVSSSLAVDGEYHLVHSDSDGDYIEYQVPLITSESARTKRHIVLTGITGSDRGIFRVQVRAADGTLLKDYTSSSTYIDQYSSTASQRTWVVDTPADGEGGFTIPAAATSGQSTHLKVRFIVAGKNGSSSGRKMAFDLIGISDQHSMAAFLSSGESGDGKIAIIGSIFSSFAGRGPWAHSKSLMFANNVLYNRWQMFMHLGSSTWQSDPYNIAVIGNTFIEGPSWAAWARGNSPVAQTYAVANAKVYAPTYAASPTYGNIYDAGNYTPAPVFLATALPDVSSDPTVPISNFSPLPAPAAYEAAIAGAGARPLERDSHETRIIAEIESHKTYSDLSQRLGSLKNNVADAGGWPSYAVNTTSWPIPFPSSPNSYTGDYTNIELWLHQLSALIEPGGTTPNPSEPIYEEDFDDGVADNWTGAIGTWGVTSGYYAQTANDYPDIAVYDGGTWETDFVFNASLRTSWSATNNRLGMIYNYVNASNYYYVIFNASGLAEINRVISGGSPVVVASASYSGGGSGVWFDVSVIRSGTGTTVLVNDQVVFNNIAQTELGAGKIGFITRYNASARFDNVSLSLLGGPTIFDSFESGTATGWSPDGLGTWAVASDGGGYVYRQSDDNVSANRSVRSGSAGTDQLVEARVKLNGSSGSNRFFGVVARYQNADDYYYLILRTNNTIELKRLAGGNSTNLATPVSFTVNTGTWYRLRLEVTGNQLRGYVNDTLMIQGTDSTYTSGTAGLLTFYTDVSFDDVAIDLL